MREREPKKNSSWKTKCWPEEFPFWTTLLNNFQGRFLRVFDVFPYFHVWGSQKCQENILFLKERMSFWAFKNSVHLGLKEQSFTRFCFDWFGGCRSPNRARFSFLESPLCLVYGPKISANESLYFGSNRLWSAGCSQEIRTRVTNFAIFVWGFQISKRGDSFSWISITAWSLFWNFVLDFKMCIFRVLNPKNLSVRICCETGDSVFGLSVLIRFT